MGDTARPEDLTVAQRLVGRIVGGKYEVEALIGSGAMGAVFRARQLALDKTVALKVLHRTLAIDPTLATRFHREALTASRLDHDNSVRVLDFGEEPDGLLYIAMECLDGRDLFAIIRDEAPLPTDRIARLLSQMLSALAAAHDMGILHRDLKPENIMVVQEVGDDGEKVDRVKVCDFGIAQIRNTAEPGRGGGTIEPKLSMAGVVMGTPAYMSPEQASCAQLDARSDLYAVGVILYLMLTDRLPFDAESPLRILLMHLHDEAVRPSVINPNVDPRLEAVCLRALAKDPALRFGNAREMRAALRDVLGLPAPTSAQNSPRPGRVLKNSASLRNAATSTLPIVAPTVAIPLGNGRRRRKIAGAVAAFGAISLGAVAFTVLRRSPPDPGPPGAISTTPPRNEAVVASASQNPENPEAPTSSPSPDPEVTATETRHRPSHGRPNSKSAETPSNLGTSLTDTDPASGTKAAVGAGSDGLIANAALDDPKPLLADDTKPSSRLAAANVAPADPKPDSASKPAEDTFGIRKPDPNVLHVDVGAPKGVVGTTPASVNRAIVPLAGRFTECYRSAALKADVPLDATATLHIETDDEGIVVDARVAGIGGRIKNCITRAAMGRRVANVDTGSASANIPLTFKSR